MQLRRSSRLQRCNTTFSNTINDPINLEESPVDSTMEHDEQTSTPNKSEGSARKKFKRLRHKVTAGKLFYSDVYISTL